MTDEDEDALCKRPHCHHARRTHGGIQHHGRCLIPPCACVSFVDDDIAEIARALATAPPTHTITLTADNPMHLEYLVRLLSVHEMGTQAYDDILNIYVSFHRWATRYAHSTEHP